jgi:predicted outer membrane repeat protein
LSNVNRKDGNKAHNITFVRCAFIDNVVADGDGGAAWVRSAADGWVIFDECVFRGNAATTGQGGAVFATGGKIIFGAFCSARTFSPTARRRRSIAWVPFD